MYTYSYKDIWADKLLALKVFATLHNNFYSAPHFLCCKMQNCMHEGFRSAQAIWTKTRWIYMPVCRIQQLYGMTHFHQGAIRHYAPTMSSCNMGMLRMNIHKSAPSLFAVTSARSGKLDHTWTSTIVSKIDKLSENVRDKLWISFPQTPLTRQRSTSDIGVDDMLQIQHRSSLPAHSVTATPHDKRVIPAATAHQFSILTWWNLSASTVLYEFNWSQPIHWMCPLASLHHNTRAVEGAARRSSAGTSPSVSIGRFTPPSLFASVLAS